MKMFKIGYDNFEREQPLVELRSGKRALIERLQCIHVTRQALDLRLEAGDEASHRMSVIAVCQILGGSEYIGVVLIELSDALQAEDERGHRGWHDLAHGLHVIIARDTGERYATHLCRIGDKHATYEVDKIQVIVVVHHTFIKKINIV